MRGIHDLGGMRGFGPVVAEPDEPVFHARWEGIVRAMADTSFGRRFHLDEFRHAIERMPPAEYLQSSYYEKWLHAVERVLLEKGFITEEELRTGHAAGPAPATTLAKEPRPALEARFKVGDRVTTRGVNPRGHTRLPTYALAKSGVVRTVNGPFLLPDANAHGPGAPWEACYAVEFKATDLWGESAHPADRVCIDLWESYLRLEEKS